LLNNLVTWNCFVMNPDDATLAPSSPDDRSQRLDEVVTAYLKAVEAGQAPEQGEWLARYPEFAAELQAFFAAQDEVRRLAGPLCSLPETVRYFGDYELIEEIARGGMGIVYRARQVSLNRVVALKMIREGQLASEQDVARFKAEAEAAANLDHPNILPIYEIGTHNGLHYFSMKLIEGGSLAGRVAELVEQPREAARLMVLVARAVHHAHQRGILHRDLKPGNILLDNDGSPTITDFGLARKVEGDSGLTQTGAIVGTPSYMAPEQAAARKDLSIAIDVYALGAILYELLVGQPPFRGATPVDTILQVLEKEPVAPRSLRAGADRDLETIALKGLRKEPQQRYESASLLADDLERWLRGEPILARRTGTAERAWKWLRRHPALAALSAAVIVSLVAGTIVSLLFAIQADARARESAENAQRADEKSEELRRRLYAVDMGRMHDAWRRGDVPLVKRLLEQYRGDDLCGFEYHYFDRLRTAGRRRLELPSDPSPGPGGLRELAAVAFSPDGKSLAVATMDTLLLADDVAAGKLRRLAHLDDIIQSLAFSADGRRLITASGETVTIWDTATGRELAKQGGHQHEVARVACSADGRWLMSVSRDCVVLREPGSGKEVRRFSAPAGNELGWSGAALCPKGRHLAAHLTLGEVTIWDTATGKVVRKLGSEVVDLVAEAVLTFSRDGTRLALGLGGAVQPDAEEPLSIGFENRIAIHDVASGKQLAKWQGHAGDIACMTFSPDGRWLATGAEDNTIHLWNASDGRLLRRFQGDNQIYSDLAFDPSGKVLAACGDQGALELWNAQEDPEVHMHVLPAEPPVFLVSVVAAGVSANLIVTETQTEGKDRILSVRDLTTGKILFRLDKEVGVAIFTSDGTMLAAGSNEGKVALWDVQARRQVRVLGRLSGEASKLYFSRDGRYLAATRVPGANRQRGEARVWETATGKEIVLEKEQEQIDLDPDDSIHPVHLERAIDRCYFGAWISPDGRYLASPTRMRGVLLGVHAAAVVQVIDVTSGKRCHLLHGHSRNVTHIAFHPDGKRLATASADRTIRLWDLHTGLEVLRLACPIADLHTLGFDRDGYTLMAIGPTTHSIRVWTTRSSR
jgi:WD40 repeat protein/tRNA A-37 threonylcarbamoyl transferase component Bud32